MTDSSTGGFITPISPDPDEDLALVRSINLTVAGVTGLTGPDLVRPRWQAKPLPQPDRDVNWVSVGVTSSKRDANASKKFDPDKGMITTRTVEMRLLASFYGPMSGTYADRLSAGLDMGQNREAIRSLGLAFVSVGDPLHVPELVGQEFINRVDLTFTLRRLEVHVYPVEPFKSGSVDVVAQGGSARGVETWHNPTDIGP